MKLSIKIAVRWPLNISKSSEQSIDVQERLKAMFKAAGCQGDMRINGAYEMPGASPTQLDGLILAECDVEL